MVSYWKKQEAEYISKEKMTCADYEDNQALLSDISPQANT